ncbi:right-handed parallel beta-helix repeat-containing protein [Priestia megaterium]|uniref:right-handed parallel beta-helix repeat-containing protein n=1 Tax=Priestia megaterium TaxID=1404 RepID=UPI0036720998
MASNKTPNLGMDIWAEMDYFKRTELNNNFNKIDALSSDISAKIEDIATNAKAKGAKTDGTDAKTTIQSLLDGMSSGGELIFPKGEYVISGALKPKSNTRLTLKKGAVIRSTNFNDSIIEITGKENILIEGGTLTYGQTFTFDNINSSAGADNQEGLVTITGGSSNIKVVDCAFVNAQRIGVVITKSTGNSVSNCSFSNLYAFFGVRISDDSHLNRIINNSFNYISHVGIGIYGGVQGFDGATTNNACTQNIISNNVIQNIQKSSIPDGGIGIELHNWHSFNIISNNSIRLCDSMGISCTNGKAGYTGGYCSITGNTIKDIYGVSYSGIELAGVVGCTVANNTILDTKVQGIIIESSNRSVVESNIVTSTVQDSTVRLINIVTSNHCTVKGNSLEKNGTLGEACIVVGSSCAFINISGNDVKNGIYGISLSGSGVGCIVADNVIEYGSGGVAALMITKAGTKIFGNYIVSSSAQSIFIDADDCSVSNNDINCLATSNARCIQIAPNRKNIVVTSNKTQTSQTSGTVIAIYNRSTINIAIVHNTIIGPNHVISDETNMKSYKQGNLFISDTATDSTKGQFIYGSAAPSSVPNYKNQFYLDETNNKFYVAKGVSSSADWLLLN